jgi:hypothetical protein
MTATAATTPAAKPSRAVMVSPSPAAREPSPAASSSAVAVAAGGQRHEESQDDESHGAHHGSGDEDDRPDRPGDGRRRRSKRRLRPRRGPPRSPPRPETAGRATPVARSRVARGHPSPQIVPPGPLASKSAAQRARPDGYPPASSPPTFQDDPTRDQPSRRHPEFDADADAAPEVVDTSESEFADPPSLPQRRTWTFGRRVAATPASPRPTGTRSTMPPGSKASCPRRSAAAA